MLPSGPAEIACTWLRRYSPEAIGGTALVSCALLPAGGAGMQQQGDVRDGQALLWMLSGAAIIGSNGLMVRFVDTPATISAFS